MQIWLLSWVQKALQYLQVQGFPSRFGKIVFSQVLYSHLGVSADTRDGVGPWQLFIFFNSVSLFIFLIHFFFSLKKYVLLGRTALHHAVFCPSAQNISWIISNFGNSLEAKDAVGFTTLHLAILNGK